MFPPDSSARFPAMRPRFDAGARVPYVGCLLLILVLLREFFFGFSAFPPSTKTMSPNSNLARIEDLRENQQMLM